MRIIEHTSGNIIIIYFGVVTAVAAAATFSRLLRVVEFDTLKVD